MRIGLFAPLPRYYEQAPRMKLPTVPLAPYVLASACRSAGHEPVVFDPNLYPDIDTDEDALAQLVSSVDAIGVSCHTLNWPAAYRLARLCKQIDQQKPVIMGGIHPGHFPKRVLATQVVDYVVVGDGELALPELLTSLERGQPINVSGVIGQKDSRGECKKTMPVIVPAYDLLPEGCYDTLSVETSRGCVGNCTFCSVISRNRWRPLDPDEVERLLIEVLRLADGKVTANQMYLVDDCFTVDKRRALSICEVLSDLAAQWSILLEARLPDLRQVEVLRGLELIDCEFQVGIECGYDQGINRVGKRYSVADVRNCFDELAKRNLADKAQLMFIVGLPWEGLEECLQTVRFAAAMSSDYGCKCNLSWWRPLPSQLWQERSRYGIEYDESLFDKEGWVIDPQCIDAFTPRLSGQDLMHLRSVLEGYSVMGIDLQLREH